MAPGSRACPGADGTAGGDVVREAHHMKGRDRMQYRTCTYCGASLDPGERCDCRDEEDDTGQAGGGGQDEMLQER